MSSELRELYQELILDHGRTPRNKRKLEPHDREALGHNPLCGDRLTVYLTLASDGRIADAAFEGQGCAISTASASMMTEMVKGKSAAEAAILFEHFHTICTQDDAPPAPSISAEDEDRLQALAGVRQFPVRVKCATLPWHTLQAALTRKDATSTEGNAA